MSNSLQKCLCFDKQVNERCFYNVQVTQEWQIFESDLHGPWPFPSSTLPGQWPFPSSTVSMVTPRYVTSEVWTRYICLTTRATFGGGLVVKVLYLMSKVKTKFYMVMHCFQKVTNSMQTYLHYMLALLNRTKFNCEHKQGHTSTLEHPVLVSLVQLGPKAQT